MAENDTFLNIPFLYSFAFGNMFYEYAVLQIQKLK